MTGYANTLPIQVHWLWPVANPITRNLAGEVFAPDAPGLGVKVDTDALKPYLVDTEIKVGGKVIYATPSLE